MAAFDVESIDILTTAAMVSGVSIGTTKLSAGVTGRSVQSLSAVRSEDGCGTGAPPSSTAALRPCFDFRDAAWPR